MPVIRQLCNKTGAPTAPHHIFAGVSSILASQEQQSAAKILALIVAVQILVTTRLAGTETAPDEYQNRRTLAVEIVNDAARKDDAYMEVVNTDIDNCMREIMDQKWTKMDWFGNIIPGAGVRLDDGAEDDAEDGSNDDEADEGGLLPVTSKIIGRRDSLERDYLQAGLGTMVRTPFPFLRCHPFQLTYLQMRDQVDYLSDHRRREYQVWKKDILIQIEELEKSQEMEVGSG